MNSSSFSSGICFSPWLPGVGEDICLSASNYLAASKASTTCPSWVDGTYASPYAMYTGWGFISGSVDTLWRPYDVDMCTGQRRMKSYL